MNIECPTCHYNYSARRIPKNLRNCDHVICQKCLISTEKCLIDGVKIQLKKFGMKGFATNQEILDEAKGRSDNGNANLNQKKAINAPSSRSLVQQNEKQNQARQKKIAINSVINKQQSKVDQGKITVISSKKIIENPVEEVQNVKTTKKIPQQLILKQNNQKAIYSSKKLKRKSIQLIETPIKSPKKDDLKCKIHLKNADVICLDDGQIICASCALFGDHKGHTVQDTKNFVVKLGQLTQQTLQLFKQIKQKQDCLNNEVVQDFIQRQFHSKKTQQIKLIKQFCTKLTTVIKNAQKSMIDKLDNFILSKKQKLLSQINLNDLQIRTKEWYRQVEKLSGIMQSVYRMEELNQGLKYLDSTFQESYVLKKGQYLKLEYNSSENVYKNQIEQEAKSCQIKLDESLLEKIEHFCQIGKQGNLFNILKLDMTGNSCQVNSSTGMSQQKSFKNFSTPILQNQNCKNKSNDKQTTIDPTVDQQDQDILLDNDQDDVEQQRIHNTILSLQEFDMENNFGNDRSNFLASNSSIYGQMNKIDNQKLERARKNSFKFSSTQRNISALRLTSNNKKKNFFNVQDKYLNIIEGLKKDRLQIADFSGAEMGDSNLILICQYIAKSSKLKTLKLNKNKLTDQCLQFLIHSCQNSKITTLNLNNNFFTEKSVGYFQKININNSKPLMRHIGLNFNKITKKLVKKKIDDLGKINIMITV